MLIQVQIVSGDTVLGIMTAEQFMSWTGIRTEFIQTLVEKYNVHNQEQGIPERAHLVILHE